MSVMISAGLAPFCNWVMASSPLVDFMTVKPPLERIASMLIRMVTESSTIRIVEGIGVSCSRMDEGIVHGAGRVRQGSRTRPLSGSEHGRQPPAQEFLLGRDGDAVRGNHQHLQRCRMQMRAGPHVDARLAMSLEEFQQGHGLVDPANAVDPDDVLAEHDGHHSNSFRFSTNKTRPSPSSAVPA